MTVVQAHRSLLEPTPPDRHSAPTQVIRRLTRAHGFDSFTTTLVLQIQSLKQQEDGILKSNAAVQSLDGKCVPPKDGGSPDSAMN